jgi:molybdopterin-guanine dinucleotide biosynthesis protein A
MMGSPSRAFVLAGGRATRMGFDKARAPFFSEEGVLISLAIATALPLVSLGLDVTIVRRSDSTVGPWTLPDNQTLAEAIEPDAPSHHPLWGVGFALSQTDRDALIVPCDMPWVSIESWRRILDQQAPVVAVGDDGGHPLLGRFPTTWQAKAMAFAGSDGRVSSFADKASHILLPDNELRNANSLAALTENWRGRVDALSAEERSAYGRRGVVFPLKG